MMRAMFKGFGIAAAAAMMTVTTAASAQSAVATPATATIHGGNALHSDTDGTTLIEIGILAALVVIVLVATRNGGSSGTTPTSP